MVEAGQCGVEMEWTYPTFTLVSAVISGLLIFFGASCSGCGVAGCGGGGVTPD
jgi:hypothetical protein